MHVFETAAALNGHLDKIKAKGRSIGFVPTMGALHNGHLALIGHSARENDETLISIFVNPTQFNNSNDLKKYPRDPGKDIQKLESTPCNIVFLPKTEEVYPHKIESRKIDLGGLDKHMEGAHRPGHFAGVATVVWRLLELTRPTRAYFGEKDYQQFRIIQHLQQSQRLPVEIVPHSIERNAGGLALSSRNELLSEDDREEALAIYRNLKWARQAWPNHSPAEIKQQVQSKFERESLQLEYVEIVNEQNLQPIAAWSEARNARIFIAAHISGVRLIDNFSLF